MNLNKNISSISAGAIIALIVCIVSLMGGLWLVGVGMTASQYDDGSGIESAAGQVLMFISIAPFFISLLSGMIFLKLRKKSVSG
jgi:hypothetical protein